MPVAVLFVMAVASIGIYGIVLGGWSSGSTYSLLGGLRSSAQMISYEVAMGSRSGRGLPLRRLDVDRRRSSRRSSKLWYGVILLPSFVIYMISMVGETNRAPFDLPEAEGELVGGFHTEYSSLKFALFFLAEYINMATVSALATTLFLGGWRAPFWIDDVWPGANQGYWPLLWFIGKVLLFIFVFIWLRGTLPRLRYDQFMAFGWKVLIPISLVWIIAVASIRTVSLEAARSAGAGSSVSRRARSPCSSSSGSSATPRTRARSPRTSTVRRASRAATRCRRCPARRSPARSRRRDRGDGRRRIRRHRGGRRSDGKLKEQFWDPVAGFGVTFRTMFRKVVTEQYPFEKLPTAPRFHGRHQLNRWPDGLEKCIGCELCAWACPADAIYVEGASNDGDGERFSPGERYGRVYQINYLRCILCGLCIEACPTRALTMTNEYELADNSREPT